jgi:hypothetical protein
MRVGEIDYAGHLKTAQGMLQLGAQSIVASALEEIDQALQTLHQL